MQFKKHTHRFSFCQMSSVDISQKKWLWQKLLTDHVICELCKEAEKAHPMGLHRSLSHDRMNGEGQRAACVRRWAEEGLLLDHSPIEHNFPWVSLGTWSTQRNTEPLYLLFLTLTCECAHTHSHTLTHTYRYLFVLWAPLFTWKGLSSYSRTRY